YEFVVTHHVGRAVHAYDSHPRPPYYYGLTVWEKFAPGSLLLPFAAVHAWRTRHQTGNRAGLFFLSTALGAGLLLSVPTAKENAYLLPAYPALACLVAGWWIRKDGAPVLPPRVLAGLLWGLSVLLVSGLLIFTWQLGAVTPSGICG